MTTNAICMVNGIRLQKPSPNATAVSCGEAPMASAASATMTTPSAAKIYASGNQRSAHAESRRAARTSHDPCGRITVLMLSPPAAGGQCAKRGSYWQGEAQHCAASIRRRTKTVMCDAQRSAVVAFGCGQCDRVCAARADVVRAADQGARHPERWRHADWPQVSGRV